MSKYVLEVCVDSVESAIAAEKGGATRLELCSNLVIGGTTPSKELLEMVKEVIKLPVHVLVRPRYGDFLYTDFEYELICRQITDLVKAGADGVVIGSLNCDGSLNEQQMRDMIACAGGKHITLHRAFDVSKNLCETMETARRLGVHTILTSGAESGCLAGMDTIARLLAAAKGMEILIGGGVNARVIEQFCKKMPAVSFHMSGKEVLESGMRYRNERVAMGVCGISEFELWRTSEKNVAEAVSVLVSFYG